MKTTIIVEHLCKAYNGMPAVKDLTFTVGRGEIFGLLGANGAGKSTSIECILGTKTADSGKVSILGMNPAQERKAVFERVGVQFQEGSYQDKITVVELCQETGALYKNCADYKQLLKTFNLEEKLKSPISELSGGQKQKLLLILALIPKPEVVLLDELTTGLDARARRQVWNYLLALKEKGLTVLLTSHFMDEVETLCDRIVILKKGETVFEGTGKEAIRTSPFERLEDAYLWYTDEEKLEYEHI